MRHSVLAAAAAGVLLSVMAATYATPAIPDYIPLRRLLTNATAYVKTHPDDPDGFYILGRLQYFAANAPQGSPQTPVSKSGPSRFSRSSPDQVPVYGYERNDPLPYITEGPTRFARTPAEQIGFIRDAVRNLSHAIALRNTPGARKSAGGWARKPGYVELCLASTLEASAAQAKEAGPLPPTAPIATPNAWREVAIKLYKRVWDTRERLEPSIFSPDYEASAHWLRLVQERGPTLRERVEMAQVALERKRIESRPRPISPIVLSLTPGKRLNQLLDAQRRVTFDLHGDGLKRTHTWLKPDTGLLVWDPARTGTITSGKQLFGSVSWWLFWRNGYQALAALDDNRDGKITGGELSGLALWFDRNQNGVSDPGEVTPLSQTPIVSLSTGWTGRVGPSWESRGGAMLRDGTRLTTWDWVTR